MSLIQTIKSIFQKEREDFTGREVEREFIINEITDQNVWLENVPESSAQTGLQYAVPRKHVDYPAELHDKIENLEEDRETVYNARLVCLNKAGTSWRLKSINQTRTLYS